jgi:squalene-hopene/tetraprenyl-beta-curcumene cyclase
MLVVALVGVCFVGRGAEGIDEAHHATARGMIEKSIDYLRAQQDEQTGGWAVPQGEGRPHLPAITGLVVSGMLMDPGIDMHDPAVTRGVDYMLGFLQADGGIYDGILASYNTSIAVSALSKVRMREADDAVRGGVAFLKGLQWSEDSAERKDTGKVDQDHPFYGGIGYGQHGRPDNSNLAFMMQALEDAGVGAQDESVRRAVRFLERTQMLDEVNDQAYADGSSQGGFIYAPGESSAQAGEGESKSGMMTETLDDGTEVSRLRAYGSITYAAFKSYLYADLERDDVRVTAAMDWIRNNYTLEENPGMGNEGMYYYFAMFAKALDAYGVTTLEVEVDGAEREGRDWANDLVDRLDGLQEADGSFRVLDDRWMENNKVLITAYCLLALQHAVD